MERRRFFLSSAALGATIAFSGCHAPPQFTLQPADFAGRAQAADRLQEKLHTKGFHFGAPVHLMAYKREHLMELWLERNDGNFERFHTYDICNFSGTLGPKLQEGDRQTPEGFYEIMPQMLNPWSAFHLGVNLGFPNHYDQSKGRTGSLIAIHGGCSSIGCYAMGNRGVEEIYLIIEQAFLQGAQRATFAAYPFRPSEENLQAIQGHQWEEFWQNIFESHRHFEAKRRPPYYGIRKDRYLFTSYPQGTNSSLGYPKA